MFIKYTTYSDVELCEGGRVMGVQERKFNFVKKILQFQSYEEKQVNKYIKPFQRAGDYSIGFFTNSFIRKKQVDNKLFIHVHFK